MKSRGYQLNAEMSLTQAEKGFRVSERPMKEFLQLCEATPPGEGGVCVFSDMDARALFLVSPDPEPGQLIVCRFR